MRVKAELYHSVFTETDTGNPLSDVDALSKPLGELHLHLLILLTIRPLVCHLTDTPWGGRVGGRVGQVRSDLRGHQEILSILGGGLVVGVC